MVLGSIFMTLLDIVIDPVAYRGDRWFLGKIYEYEEKGDYFGIPLTNFLGWIVTGIFILGAYFQLEKFCKIEHNFLGPYSLAGKALLAPALYFGILIFNLAVTFAIGEKILGGVGLWISCCIFIVIFEKIYLSEEEEKIEEKKKKTGKKSK